MPKELNGQTSDKVLPLPADSKKAPVSPGDLVQLPGHVWGHRGCVFSAPRGPLVPEQGGPDSTCQSFMGAPTVPQFPISQSHCEGSER